MKLLLDGCIALTQMYAKSWVHNVYWHAFVFA